MIQQGTLPRQNAMLLQKCTRRGRATIARDDGEARS